jgi:hypothetical protein
MSGTKPQPAIQITEQSAGPAGPSSEQWLRRACAIVLAAVAAYASYEHQRTFALRGGADPAGASLWPLSVDGLLVLATIGLLKPHIPARRRTRYAVRSAFTAGIAVSLAANVAAAPHPVWQPILVAGWPPVALLLAVELLATGPAPRERAESVRPPTRSAPLEPENEKPAPHPESERGRDSKVSKPSETKQPSESRRSATRRPRTSANAEDAMWNYFQQERAKGRTPTGAELARAVGTNNYGRAVLAQWRRTGRLPAEPPPLPDLRGVAHQAATDLLMASPYLLSAPAWPNRQPNPRGQRQVRGSVGASPPLTEKARSPTLFREATVSRRQHHGDDAGWHAKRDRFRAG